MRCLHLIGLVACSSMIANCVGSRRPSLAAAPQIEMPAEAARPCSIYRLPVYPRVADLEVGFAVRGAELVACDGARSLAVDTHAAEHQLEAAQQKARSREHRWWKVW